MRKPRKRKSFEELTALADHELSLSSEGIVMQLEDKDQAPKITYLELVKKFYRINRTLHPVATKLESDFSGAFIEKIWYVVWYGSFHMDISIGSETAGPHRCRLWFRTFTKPVDYHWLAAAQLMAFFFNEKEIKEGAKTIIKNKEFYILPQNEQIEIQP
jgi:hypothetical protein